jgi:hypothetical protein
MISLKNIITDINGILVANIGTIIPSGDSTMIDWNEGIALDHTSKDKFIQPIIYSEAVANEIYKVEADGFLTINYFEKNGNNILGAGVIDAINGIFVNTSFSNTVRLRFQLGSIIANEKDEETQHFMTSWRCDFKAYEI